MAVTPGLCTYSAENPGGVCVCVIGGTCVFRLQQMLGMTVPVSPEDGSTQHTYGIDIRMMHLSAKDFFNVWDFAGQVHTHTRLLRLYNI